MNPNLEGRLRIAVAFVLAGLAVQSVTLLWNHPLAFLAFILVASPITAAGVLVYLTALIRE